MRRLLNDKPPVYCSIPEAELVSHYTATYAPAQHLAPPPSWLHQQDVQGEPCDVLKEPFTPQEVIEQIKQTKKSAPGIDKITYAQWRWVDPIGLILSMIFYICRLNSRIPSDWKHATVTLIHKGGDTSSVRNWRPICLQLTIYKIYTALLARRIKEWSYSTSAFSPAQKGFLSFDGCVEHNFLLQAILTDSRRRKKDLMLAWLDLRDAFGSVLHELILLMMRRLGLSSGILKTVQDNYSNSSVAIKTGRSTFTQSKPQGRGVKQGCPLSPILFNIALEGLLRHVTSSGMGYAIAGNTVTSLAYADDVCIAVTSKSDLQALLDRCMSFAGWAGLTFNAKKCGSLCMFNHRPRIYVDPFFTPLLGQDTIPALAWGQRYKY